MIKNDFQVLPFYASLEEHNHRKSYAYGHICPVITDSKFLPSFQIQLDNGEGFDITPPKNAGDIFAAAYLKDLNDNIVMDLKMFFVSNMRFIKGSSENLVVGAVLPPARIIDLPLGEYYIHIRTAKKLDLYSEVICITDFIADKIALTWYDLTDLNIGNNYAMQYGNGYRNFAFFNSEVGKPNYELDEEGEERDGYFFAEKQISKKTYRFTFVAPEYMCDILRLAPMSDTAVITYKNKSHRCDSILVNVDWEDQGDLANVEIEFTTDSIIKKIATKWPKR